MLIRRVNLVENGIGKVGFAIPVENSKLWTVKFANGIRKVMEDKLIFFTGQMSEYDLPKRSVNRIFQLN